METRIDARDLVRTPLLIPSPLEAYKGRAPRMTAREGVALVAFDGDGVEENVLFVYAPMDPQLLLEEAEQFFGSTAFAIIVESETNEELEERLEADGWLLEEDEPSLLLYPIPEPPMSPDELEIRTVRRAAEYETFMRLSQTGQRWIPSLEAATDLNVSLLVGYVAGKPVATARISCLGRVGEINGVDTVPEYRRRGIGTAMTWAAVAAGIERGCDVIILSASEMGFPVYRRMGFVPICRYRTYIRPD